MPFLFSLGIEGYTIKGEEEREEIEISVSGIFVIKIGPEATIVLALVRAGKQNCEFFPFLRKHLNKPEQLVG